MTVWFTSDQHFGHKRIIELAKRPFASVEEMDMEMIRRWNECVQPGDQVYHLGDFSFADQTKYLPFLAGDKKLIKGNHDHSNRMHKPGWSSIDDLLSITVDNTNIVLCHYGLRVWRNSGKGDLHFYGHSHGNLPGDRQSCDVGVDVWNFYPVKLDRIKEYLAKLPARTEPDHH
jgi:calcineurin-like phosphoesterase family protein